ncbi:unnamed protein product [Orchesella dallaii]|uniref:Uncharacterized protein n=1 Tax=Orchesella dallaii TaxID=48710 RepID=A0ABP1RSZ4_9HEXA
MKWRLRNIDKMTFLQNFLRLLLVLSIFQVNNFIVTVNCLPKGVPGLAAIIPPPQVLLPPHREEGQPLDEIYLLGTGPKRTVPSLHRAPNINVVQTFIPPPAPPPSPSSKTSKAPSSAEEITIPQIPKLRSPHRKQYTKADLIAAANSLRPAGFDFNKVLFVTPQRLAAANAGASPGGHNNGSKLVSVKDNSDTSLVPLYEHVMFPLPLFDTPVFNELRPLMEMLMKEAGTKFSKFGAPGDSNKKVLVILPKSMLTSSSLRSLERRNQQPIKQTRTAPIKAQLQTHSRAQPFQKTSTPSQIKREQASEPKFIIVPKGTKLRSTTTSKPKLAPSSTFTTTKRVLKSVKSSHSPPTKKPEKGVDLQVAATSNKFSHRSGTGGNLPSGGGSSSSVDSEKRSYSISKGGDKYSFSYAVKNDEFKDVKSHSESRDGNMVEGEYSMLEPDGYTRVVRYTVDSDQGFKASVKRIPPS